MRILFRSGAALRDHRRSARADSGSLLAKLNIVDNAARSPQVVPSVAPVVKVDVRRI
jgi:hypothetical protein